MPGTFRPIRGCVQAGTPLNTCWLLSPNPVTNDSQRCLDRARLEGDGSLVSGDAPYTVGQIFVGRIHTHPRESNIVGPHISGQQTKASKSQRQRRKAILSQIKSLKSGRSPEAHQPGTIRACKSVNQRLNIGWLLSRPARAQHKHIRSCQSSQKLEDFRTGRRRLPLLRSRRQP